MAVLSLTWKSPYVDKTVFILRRGPELASWGYRCSVIGVTLLRIPLLLSFGLNMMNLFYKICFITVPEVHVIGRYGPSWASFLPERTICINYILWLHWFQTDKEWINAKYGSSNQSHMFNMNWTAWPLCVCGVCVCVVGWGVHNDDWRCKPSNAINKVVIKHLWFIQISDRYKRQYFRYFHCVFAY